MNEITVELFDSDNNQVLALVRYNRNYSDDYTVLAAQIFIDGKEISLDNLRMIEAQYKLDIQRAIGRDKE